MNSRYRSSSEQRLARRLVREADGAAPEFSDSLHERLMERLSDAAPVSLPRPIHLARRQILRLAATIAVVAGVWWTTSPKPPAVVPTSTFSLPTPPQVLSTTVGRPVEQAMAGLEEQRLAYLDEDAANLAQFMMDQIPFGSAER